MLSNLHHPIGLKSLSQKSHDEWSNNGPSHIQCRQSSDVRSSTTANNVTLLTVHALTGEPVFSCASSAVGFRTASTAQGLHSGFSRVVIDSTCSTCRCSKALQHPKACRIRMQGHPRRRRLPIPAMISAAECAEQPAYDDMGKRWASDFSYNST